jgi:hypothetical protein
MIIEAQRIDSILFEPTNGPKNVTGPQPMELGTIASTPTQDSSSAITRDICYYCKQPGHFKKDCPKLKKQQGNDRRQ